MRFSRPTVRVPIHILALSLAVMLPGVVGCPKQEDFPVALDVDAPPTPTNFVITRVEPDEFDYDFSWSISDPGAVDHYRVYLVGGGALGTDELLFETPNTFYPATFTFSLTGLQFAVSAVSPGSVEGNRRVANAP